MDKKDIRNLEKENVMLSGELLKVANQLEEWSKRFSTCDQTIMKEMVIDIRHEVRGTKFFEKGECSIDIKRELRGAKIFTKENNHE